MSIIKRTDKVLLPKNKTWEISDLNQRYYCKIRRGDYGMQEITVILRDFMTNIPERHIQSVNIYWASVFQVWLLSSCWENSGEQIDKFPTISKQIQSVRWQEVEYEILYKVIRKDLNGWTKLDWKGDKSNMHIQEGDFQQGTAKC